MGMVTTPPPPSFMDNFINFFIETFPKTYPAICLPLVLDILRDKFGHECIPLETRVLYILPLVNIFKSLESEMNHLNIPNQIIEAGSGSEIDRQAKVVCLSPEKIVNCQVMKSILCLHWSVIVIDEPHLMLLWGTSKTKKKPFRKAMTELSKLNNLGTVFECHSATIENFDILYSFFGRKKSVWKKQIMSPNRSNLTYYLLNGVDAPENVLQLSCVRNVLESEYHGITLIYVQRISDGTQIFFSLLEYCEKQGLINYSPHEKSPKKPFAFLHAKLTEQSKKAILSDASNNLIKILIATSSAGCGINLPITVFVGWGLDPEPSGVIQASGRTSRQPISEEGSVIWVHNSKLHGRRIPSTSKVRDLLKTGKCLRFVMNNWFAHGEDEAAEVRASADVCCSNCMKECMRKSDCIECSRKLKKFSRDNLKFDNSGLASKTLSGFLQTLDLNKDRNKSTLLNEDNLAKEILTNFEENEDVEESKQFMEIFSLSKEQISQIIGFLRNDLQSSDPELKQNQMSQKERQSRISRRLDAEEVFENVADESEVTDSESSGSLIEEEYFDSEEDA